MGNETVTQVRRGADMGVAGKTCQQAVLIVDVHIDAVDEGGRVLLADIVAALEHRQTADGGGGNFQTISDRVGQRLRRMVERQAQFPDTDHAVAPCCP